MASVDKVKLYIEKETPGIPSIPADQTCPLNDGDDFLHERKELDKLFSPVDREQMIEGDDLPDIGVFIVKTISQENPRAQADDFKVAKRIEVEELQQRNLWHIVKSDSIPPNANILGDRFVLTLKN